MKINVERGAFLKALNHVQSVVERRNTIPILSNVLIEASKGELKLTATDLDIEIVEGLPADVLRNGAATAPAHMLYDIVRKLPDGAQVQVELLNTTRSPANFNYHFEWFDANGMQLNTVASAVIADQIQGGEDKFISCVAPTPACRDFRDGSAGWRRAHLDRPTP